MMQTSLVCPLHLPGHSAGDFHPNLIVIDIASPLGDDLALIVDEK